MTRLFTQLGFDDDGETDHTGFFPRQTFTSEHLVAALIDYIDQDSNSYEDVNFAEGIESDLPDGYFPNRRVRRVGELSNIPGYTPNRMQKMLPYLTVFGNSRVKLNVAPSTVLKSLHQQIGEPEVNALIASRGSDEGPFDNTPQGNKLRISEIIGDDIYSDITPMISVGGGRWFQVLAKVDYGTATYFMRAYLSKASSGELPRVRSVELFG